MNNKENKKHISMANASPNAPQLSLPVFGDKLYLAAHSLATAPMIYSLTMPWDKQGISICMRPQPILYSFDSVSARDNYMAALKHVMLYQRFDKNLAELISMYDKEVKQFNAIVSKVEAEYQR